MAARLSTFVKHLWMDEDDSRRAISPEILNRITERVASSETLHGGEIRICVEAALPLSELWQVCAHLSLQQVIRARARTLFGALGVWDTAQNNGVLIYLLLAEHAIELVADRGLNDRIDSAHWAALAARMGEAFRQGHYEDGLTQAIDEVSAVLTRHFAKPDGASSGAGAHNLNELPDTPTLL
jgi:uncharacterized membrane protein